MKDNLDYIEISCTINPKTEENSEIVIAYLTTLGFEGFMETETGINAYIPEAKFNKNNIKDFEKKFNYFKLHIDIKTIKDENWNETWTNNYFAPIIFENKLTVRASFHKTPADTDLEIIIDPKTAFGTGNHATTYLLIEEILNLDIKDKSVLDMGCGTGILAILSKKKLSARTLAADNDPKAVLNTEENIIINNTPDIEVITGDLSSIKNETFDIIYENIWKNIVLKDIPKLAEKLNNNGILLTSGFYFNEYKDIKNAGEKNGLKFESVKEKNGWATVKFSKKH